MSWSQRQEQQNNVLVTAQTLEERINMYISAMDRATAMNNGHQSSQLQQDIQKLVDLMEKISSGQVVMEQEVPPPLEIISRVDVLANPLGELSSRLAEYHKALYFAEEELSEDRMNKIQRLQRGLQTIHELQKRAQAGFPVRVDEIPPAVTIPSDDEFDPDAIKTLTSRVATYTAALSVASSSEKDRRRIPKLQSAMRTVEFLLTRAKAKRPVWKKDIPPEFEYCVVNSGQSQGQPTNKAKFTLQLRSLQKRVQNITFKDKDQQKHLDELKKKIQDLEVESSGKKVSGELDSSLALISKEVDSVEKIAFAEKTKDLNRSEENLDLIEIRMNEYKTAALASKRDGQVSHAIQHFKIVKGLQALKVALEKGESVDMTLVPPPPREFTPTSESLPSLSESNKGLASTDATHNAVGANAHLSAVILKPAVESAEDKLAKKLYSYLDKGTDLSQSTSKQMLNIHNITVSSAQSLPKVPNTEAGKENMADVFSNNSDSIDSAESLLNETEPSIMNEENRLKDDAGERILDFKENMFVQPNSSNTDDCTADNTYNGVSEREPSSKTESEGQGKIEKVEPMNNSNQAETISHTNTSSSSTSDIYVRKTLDTVGFLSCQNVPDHSAQSIAVSVSSGSDELRLTSIEANIDRSTNLEKRTDDRAHSSNVSSLSHIDLPSSHLINTFTQSESDSSTPLVTMNSTISNTQCETLPGEKSSKIEISYDYLATSNDWSSVGPSNASLPIYDSDIYSDNTDNGPSSLPPTLVPKVMTHLSGGKDARQSLPIAHIPAINESPASVENANISHSNSSARDLDQQLSHGEKRENRINSNKELNNSVKDFPTSEMNGRSSPDTLEFLDLMDSMAIPSTATMPLTSFSSSVVKIPSHPNKQLESPLLNLQHRVKSEHNTDHQDISTLNSESSDLKVYDQTSNYFGDPSAVSSNTLASSVHDLNRSVTNGEVKNNSSFISKDVSISSYVSQDYLHPSSSSAVSNLSDHHHHVTHTSDNYPIALKSGVLEHNHQSVLNGNFPTVTTSNLQLQNYQPQYSTSNSTTSSHSTQSVRLLSKSKSVNSARPASVLAYSDVAFTCLENLKYDCLLSLAKNTEDSKQEEQKLRTKFELIKNKLQNGGKRTWEVYKACVEREHASLIQQIEDLCLLQQWSDVQLLSEKKIIAEKELLVLRERLPELKY